MPFKSIKNKYQKMISLYGGGMSAKEVATILGFKHSNSVRQVLKKMGKLRTQSDASVLAVNSGKKDAAIALLIKSAKSDNRENPAKHRWSGTPELHPRWKADRTKLKTKRSFMEERKFLSSLIKERGFKCELTGEGGKLSVHHIKGVWKYRDLMFDKGNCIVIQYSIHRQFHNMYGWKTDEKEWLEFVAEKQYCKYKIIESAV